MSRLAGRGIGNKIMSADDIVDKFKTNQDKLRGEVKEKVLGYILAALGLVAGLAWNDAIKGMIDYFFPASSNGLIAKFFYAFFLTVIVVAVTIFLTRLLKKDKEN